MEDFILKIHANAVRILAEIGIRLLHPEVLDLLRRHGIRVSGNRCFFTEAELMHWVGKAPPTFTLYARNPRHNMVIGGERTHCAPGYGSPTIISFDGSRRQALLKDYLTFAKLVQQSPQFDINGGILAQPNDVAPDTSHLVMLYAAIIASDKCLLGIPGHAREIQAAMSLLASFFGGMEEFTATPRVLIMISTISPLVIDKMALDSVLACSRYNQPMIISPAPAAGTTGPIDLAGNISLATAEALACIAIAQMAREGVPVIFGLQAYGADLRTGDISIGSPAYALQASYCARLARHYNLPSRAGGATTDAPAVTVQSGYESMLAVSTGFENRINLMMHSAGILDRFAGMSYAQFIVDLELIRMVQFYRNGISVVSEDDLSFDVIRAAGPGGQFLTQVETLRKCRSHSWLPSFSGTKYAEGAHSPADRLIAGIRKQMDQLLAGYKTPDIDQSALQEVERFLTQEAGIAATTIHAIRDEVLS